VQTRSRTGGAQFRGEMRVLLIRASETSEFSLAKSNLTLGLAWRANPNIFSLRKTLQIYSVFRARNAILEKTTGETWRAIMAPTWRRFKSLIKRHRLSSCDHNIFPIGRPATEFQIRLPRQSVNGRIRVL